MSKDREVLTSRHDVEVGSADIKSDSIKAKSTLLQSIANSQNITIDAIEGDHAELLQKSQPTAKQEEDVHNSYNYQLDCEELDKI